VSSKLGTIVPKAINATSFTLKNYEKGTFVRILMKLSHMLANSAVNRHERACYRTLRSGFHPVLPWAHGELYSTVQALGGDLAPPKRDAVDMTVHRRSILASHPAPELGKPTPDPFGVRLAGRHLYDRATHAYVRLDEPSHLVRLAEAYHEVYAAPAESAPRATCNSVQARAQLRCDFLDDFAAAVESAFDIDVIRLDGVDGDFAFGTGGRAVIVVGTTPNWFFQNWSIAHELGHILGGELDADAEPSSSRASERAANAFASELLLPSIEVLSRDWLEPAEADVADFVWNSGVSTRALASRLRSLMVETSPGVRAMLSTSTSRLVQRGNILRSNPSELSRRAALSASPRFPPDLLDAHRIAVAEGRIPSVTLDWMFEQSQPTVL
jgi:hypothetical protein